MASRLPARPDPVPRRVSEVLLTSHSTRAQTVETSARASSKPINPWYWVVAGLLAAVLLYYAFKGVEWGRVWHIMLGAHRQYLVGFTAIAALNFFLRSLRWRILLNARGRFKVGIVFWATMAGYLGNNFLPARAGEVIRSFIISDRSALSRTYVLTTALTERLMDAIALVLCGSIVLLQVEHKPPGLELAARTTAIVAAFGALMVVVLPYAGGPIEKILRLLPLPAALRDRLLGFVKQILLGLQVLHHPARLFGFTAFTALVWTGDALSLMVGARAFDIHLAFPVAVLLLAGMGLGSALPSAPGYIGIYQFAAVTILPPFGIDRNAALAFIIVGQVIGYLVVLLLGLLSLYQIRKTASSEPH